MKVAEPKLSTFVDFEHESDRGSLIVNLRFRNTGVVNETSRIVELLRRFQAAPYFGSVEEFARSKRNETRQFGFGKNLVPTPRNANQVVPFPRAHAKHQDIFLDGRSSDCHHFGFKKSLIPIELSHDLFCVIASRSANL